MKTAEFRITGPIGTNIDTRTRAARIAALAANGKSPVRTPAALNALSDKELSNLEAHVRNLEAADPYAAAKKMAPRTAQASDDADYKPYGEPPNGYAIALAARARGEGR